MMRHQHQPARGTVLIVVLWAVAIGALICSSIQLFGYRQANMGSEALARIQARWAARAGVEQTLAVMADYTATPDPDDAFAMVRAMENVAVGDLQGAAYDIVHYADHKLWAGPMDEHSKLNVNLGNRGLLLLLDDMTFEIADATSDWLDEDDDVDGFFGAEREYYLSLETAVEPRNGPMHSIAEMELVAGLWPEYLRGEDWNLNNRLDPNENDGNLSFPDDEPDDDLDASWSGQLTAHSRDGGATWSGLPRLRLATAKPDELAERLEISDAQARALIKFGRSPNVNLEQLYTTPLSSLASTGTEEGGDTQDGESMDLTDEQRTRVMMETSIAPIHERRPGKININTVSADLFRDIVTTIGLDEVIADEILYIRNSRAEGIVSLTELQSIFDEEEAGRLLQTLAPFFTTSSNVYTISSRGVVAPGIEVEIIAVVDRSTVPIKILEYREQ
jgi:hypothetical protein